MRVQVISRDPLEQVWEVVVHEQHVGWANGLLIGRYGRRSDGRRAPYIMNHGRISLSLRDRLFLLGYGVDFYYPG